MKDYDDLISRFGEIQDLPVSEELLGAYLEGNLDVYEMTEVSNLIYNDPSLKSMLNDATLDNIYNNQIIETSEIDLFERETLVREAVDYCPVCSEDFLQPETNVNEIDIDSTLANDHTSGFVDDASFELPDFFWS